MQKNKQIHVTEDGLKNLEQELDNLKTVKRKEIIETIKVALSFGDLSENSEYDDAKNEQAVLESRIEELENTIKNCVILDKKHIKTDTVKVGLQIKLHNLTRNKKVEYTLVSMVEADAAAGKISDESPVGKALLGHKVGDEVTVSAPSGDVEYKILGIKLVKDKG